MMLELVSTGPVGFEQRLFECPKCDHAEISVIAADPLNSRVTGWLAGELGMQSSGLSSREQRHARQTKPRSAMHVLRFSHETDGD
jgi:hypothetical protein